MKKNARIEGGSCGIMNYGPRNTRLLTMTLWQPTIFVFLCYTIIPSISFHWSGVSVCQMPIFSMIPNNNGALQLNNFDSMIPYPSRTALFAGAVNSKPVVKVNKRVNDPIFQELEEMKKGIMQLLRSEKYENALLGIGDMLRFVKDHASSSSKEQHTAMSVLVDNTIRALTDQAFAPPYRGSFARKRVRFGLTAIELQTSSSSILAHPYDKVLRFTFVSALKALSGVVTQNVDEKRNNLGNSTTATNASFRILQRLVTGAGVRHTQPPGYQQKHGQQLHIPERDFNLVLNSLCTMGQMEKAHKVVALQERTAHAQPLTAVGVSILLRGYGRLKDLENLEMTLSHAQQKSIEPDIVMLNSLIDAYVNCDAVDSAHELFNFLKEPQEQTTAANVKFKLLISHQIPRPNVRTYNTMLKGLAKTASLSQALHLSKEMQTVKIWDDVTTNTLVKVAVAAKDFDVAESLLSNFTASLSPQEIRQKRQHPNVEAYTELLDGYAKSNMLSKALGTLQIMRKRGVEPSVVTYTCAIGALAREKKVDQANRLLNFMEVTGIKPNLVTYNTFISGLVTRTANRSTDDREFDDYVNESIGLLSRMVNASIRPNSVTISVLVEALGRCAVPRTAEAKALVAKLEQEQIMLVEHERVGTALIHTCAAGGDVEGALQAFRRIANPDVIAINAFLDACTRCDRMKIAFETFDHYFGPKAKPVGRRLLPDVITYSTLISGLLRINNAATADRVQKLYREMRKDREIMPDTALVDILLTAMVEGGHLGLQQQDLKFVSAIFRDAEKLQYEPGQLEQRKRVVRGVMVGRMSEVWKNDEVGYGMRSTSARDAKESLIDGLFERKGWNKVDSGFRLWGGGKNDAQRGLNKDDKPVDDFLASKGWNDVDSGFRIF